MSASIGRVLSRGGKAMDLCIGNTTTGAVEGTHRYHTSKARRFLATSFGLIGALGLVAATLQIATPLPASASARNNAVYPKAGPCVSAGYSGNSAFVCQVYMDVLGRAPDPTGLASWTAALSSGVSRTQVAWDIMTSTESATDYITAAYKCNLNRAPDPTGLANWLAVLLAPGGTPDQVDAGILGSNEAFADAGSTNTGWLTLAYHCTLDRALDPTGLATWGSALASGMSRYQVELLIDSSNESHIDELNGLYGALNRAPDPTGLATWLPAMNSGALTWVQVGAEIFGSQEFYNLANS